MVTGEPGIGKTRLATALSDACSEMGMAVARGWCVDDPGAPALWPWTRLSRHVPALAACIDHTLDAPTEGAALRLSDAVADILTTAAGHTGMCVVLEDLHWADSMSTDLLLRLVQDLGSTPIVVVATAREEGVDSAFGRTFERLVRCPNTEHATLTGLSERDVVAWLDADEQLRCWAARAAELVGLTGGNPFYIYSLVTQLDPERTEDLAHALAERHTWRAMLTARFRQLPVEVRRVVAMAAVIGERLSPNLLAQALCVEPAVTSTALSTAVSAGILHFGATGLAFNHALVRDAIVVDLDPLERAALHGGAARALEATRDSLLIGGAAVHWSHVSGPAAAARCRDLATEAAGRLALSPERGLALARLALTAARALGEDGEDEAGRLLTVARLEWAAGRLHEALQSCTTGMDLARAAQRLDLMADFALVPQGIGSTDTHQLVGSMCQRALDALLQDDPIRRARLLAQSAISLAESIQVPPLLGRPLVGPAPRELSGQALAAARASGDPQAELEAIAAHHFILSYPQALDERAELAARALELSSHATTTMGVLWGHLWSADLAFQRGELALLPQTIARISAVAEQRGSPIARWHALRLTSALAMITGYFDQARDQARQARAIADRVGDISMIGMHHAFHVQLAHLRGDPGDLLPGSLEVIRQVLHIPLVQAALPLVFTLLGDPQRAMEELTPLRGLPARMPLGPRWAGTVGQISVGAVAVGDPHVARECHQLLAPTAPWCAADGGGAPFATGSVELQLGHMARTFGDDDLAAAHFTRSIAMDDRIGARPFAALGRLALAECLAATDPHRALELATRAATECRTLDMPGPLGRATTLLGRLETRERVGVRPGGLSARELEVAHLVAQAMTNQQIADRLVLSVRTIESHVRSALARLGLASRTELAVWVRDHVDQGDG